MIRPVVGVFSRVLFQIEFHGVENIPAHGGVIIAANHQTYIDPFWLSLPIKRPTRYLAWSAAFRWPVVGTGLRWLGAWPLALEGSDPAIVAVVAGRWCSRDLSGRWTQYGNGFAGTV